LIEWDLSNSFNAWLELLSETMFHSRYVLYSELGSINCQVHGYRGIVVKIDGVFNNFMNHLTGGLSMFISAACYACDRVQTSIMLLKLLPEIEVPEPFLEDVRLNVRVKDLREKFIEILAKQSPSSLNQIISLMAEIDFVPDEALVQERHKMDAVLIKYGIDYGWDPVYRCTVSMRLASGRERTVTMRDR
jgi:hypothetical protein